MANTQGAESRDKEWRHPTLTAMPAPCPMPCEFTMAVVVVRQHRDCVRRSASSESASHPMRTITAWQQQQQQQATWLPLAACRTGTEELGREVGVRTGGPQADWWLKRVGMVGAHLANGRRRHWNLFANGFAACPVDKVGRTFGSLGRTNTITYWSDQSLRFPTPTRMCNQSFFFRQRRK
jgi:hypothetical protein